MLSMENNLSSFLEWLRSVMNEKNIVPADIARTGLVTDSAISLLLKGTTKSVSIEMCKAISKASGIPLISVYRHANILPATSDDVWVEGMAEKMNKLSPNLRPIAERLLDSLIEQEESSQKKLKPKVVT